VSACRRVGVTHGRSNGDGGGKFLQKSGLARPVES